MAYEVDYLAVGDGTRCGDAIAIRFFRFNPATGLAEPFVIVIDGGTLESGERLVQHILTHYKTTVVDLAICTHADSDHVSGLRVVLQKLKVKRLWMHRPWKHAGKIRDAFADGRITNDSLERHLRNALSLAHELEGIAIEKGIPISEPFSDNGTSNRFPELTVLGPSSDYYRDLLPQFGKTPEAVKATESIFGRMVEAAKSKLEDWNVETLSEPPETRPENDASVILLLEVDGRRLLFTGDAGVPALELAADFAEDELRIDLQTCVFYQVPHHGSRRNVGPSILNRVVGPIGAVQGPKTALVSASKGGSPKHPARKVTNAFHRRGADVLATQGEGICVRHNVPMRPGWGPAALVPFYTEVDE